MPCEKKILFIFLVSMSSGKIVKQVSIVRNETATNNHKILSNSTTANLMKIKRAAFHLREVLIS